MSERSSRIDYKPFAEIPDDYKGVITLVEYGSYGHLLKDEEGNHYTYPRWLGKVLFQEKKEGARHARMRIQFELGLKVKGMEAGDAWF